MFLEELAKSRLDYKTTRPVFLFSFNGLFSHLFCVPCSSSKHVNIITLYVSFSIKILSTSDRSYHLVKLLLNIELFENKDMLTSRTRLSHV